MSEIQQIRAYMSQLFLSNHMCYFLSLGRLLFLPDEVQRAAVLRLLQHRHESLGHRARHGRAARPGQVSAT